MQRGAGITRKSRRTRTRRTRRTKPKLIARPLGYERVQTRGARHQNMRNRAMAAAVLGAGATQKQIRNYATQLRLTRRSERNLSKTDMLSAFDKDLQIALRIFNEDYLPAAPDHETIASYHEAIQRLHRLDEKINKLAGRIMKGKAPKSDDIHALRSKLADIFEDVGADISDIENAKSEKRFDVRSLLNALLE